MDLRKKASVAQRFGEGLLRFRLIFFLLSAILYFVLAPDFSDTVSYVLSSTEEFAKALDVYVKNGFAISAHYVAIIATVIAIVAIFLFRLFIGNLRSAISFVFSLVIIPLCIFILNGSEELILYIMGGVLLISVVCFFFLQNILVKAVFPFFIVGFIWTAFSCKFGVPPLMWGAILVLTSADSFAIILPCGVELLKGSPVHGALVQSFGKMIFPVLISVIVVFAIFFYFSFENFSIAKTAIASVGYMVLFFMVLFPLFSIAPLNKLRSKTRSIKI